MAEERFRIAYEDQHVLVVDKAAGVVVHPGRGNREGTLSQLLAGRVAESPGAPAQTAEEPDEDPDDEELAPGGWDPERPGIVHRLDRDTSGLLVIARTEEALRTLQRELAERRVAREYLALVEGRPPARTGTIEAPIGRDPRVRTRMAVGGAGARPARTHFTLERALPRFTLLRVRLETGRTHQIRVHMQAIGHPVAGDPEYGTAGLLGLERQFLHATRLEFDHPADGRRIEIDSPLPQDLRRALEGAGGARGGGGRLS